MTEPLFHRHLQHHFFHQFGVAIHGQEGFVGTVVPNRHKVAVTDNGVQAGNIVQRRINGRRQPLVQTYVLDVIVNRILVSLEKISGINLVLNII